MVHQVSFLQIALGSLGVLGGSVVLAAFAVDIPGGLNPLRLVLYASIPS